MVTQRFEWRGHFNDRELNALHAEAFAHPILESDWSIQVATHSLGWVTARDAGELIGFVNVPGTVRFTPSSLTPLSARREEDTESAPN